MRDDQGRPLSDRDVLARVAEIGALVVVRDPVESTDFVTWRRDLRRSARAQGLRISVVRGDGFVVVHNPDHVVTEEQRQAAFAKIAEGEGTAWLPSTGSLRRPRPPLRLVDPSGTKRRKSTPPA